MDDQAREQAFFTALTTEHVAMQSVASTTVSEATSRASLYLMSLSSSLVAMAFASQSASALPVFVAAVVPMVFVLGAFTTVRLVDTSIQNIQAQRTIARIRLRYAALTPEARAVFGPPPGDISEEAIGMMGARPGRFLLLYTMASMIAAVNAFVGGSGLALLVVWLAGTRLAPLAVAVAVIVSLALFAIVIRDQQRRFAFMDREDRARWGSGATSAG